MIIVNNGNTYLNNILYISMKAPSGYTWVYIIIKGAPEESHLKQKKN